jgi:hypothetical protein
VAGERASLMRMEPGGVYPSTTIQNPRIIGLAITRLLAPEVAIR